MENRKKWTGILLIAGILIITAAALGMNTLGASSAQADSTLQQYDAVLRELFPNASQFEKVGDTEGEFVYRAEQGGNLLGYAVQQTVQGYAGPVEVITGIRPDGLIAGIHVGGSQFNETEGLGSKAREPAFADQFKEQKLPLTLGQQIDAISGATVTSQAVVDAVNLTLTRVQKLDGIGLAPASTARPEDGMTANASAIGYGGPVLVRLTLDNQGKIAAVDIGGARFQETEGVGSKVREEAFTRQLIGRTPPLKLGDDVDAVSGATISSQAAIDAINDAAAFLTQNSASSDAN